MAKKRVQVTFSEGQWKLIEKLKSEMGETDSDVVRHIVVSWLSEKSFLSSAVKARKG
jgi:hypothetical protein